ncbi:MAG TPA: flagellar motor protein MotD [Nitrosospira sp.]
MARRRKPEEHQNHERWLVSYSDFITLLLALFVVMYAISQVNEGRYRVVAGSLVTAFGSQPNQPHRQSVAITTPDSLTPLSDPVVGSMVGSAGDSMRDYLEAKKVRRIAEAQRRQQKKMEIIARDVMAAFDSLFKSGHVRVSQSDQGVRVEIDASVLFAPGQAVLQDDSSKVLESVAQVLKNADYAIQVEGHTDNIPIVTEKFPSNWELSAVRASSVVRLLIDHGVDATRLTASGFGENRPLESNESEEGRRLNRRVTLMILPAVPDAGDDTSHHSPPDKADIDEDPATGSGRISSI